ncbi:hypothetical protein RJ639_030879 [Escallonia herrerae]|uniref:thymidine kinase n=1 Tax=Escallonia herrerae TaxID=1293975 RepID=A0AA89BB68_9ASTE|nr:hypothetical protein RJ639_030879 [Escallonia herrerae]
MLAISRMKSFISPTFSHFTPTLTKPTSLFLFSQPSTSSFVKVGPSQNGNFIHVQPAMHFPNSSASLNPSGACASRVEGSEGEIHVIVGPMFAGKTTTLLRRIRAESTNGRFFITPLFSDTDKSIVDDSNLDETMFYMVISIPHSDISNTIIDSGIFLVVRPRPRTQKELHRLGETLKGLCFSGRLAEAVGLLCRTGLQVESETYSLLLQDCIFRKEYKKGIRVHWQMTIVGFVPNEYLKTKLLILYAKAGDLDTAHVLFEKLYTKNLVSWNAMLAGYVQKGLEDVGLSLYYRMKQFGIIPDQYTFASVFRACATLAILEQGKQAHGILIKSIAIIKSNKDTRYGLDSIVTHDGEKLPCWPLADLSSFRKKIGLHAYNKLDVIGIDEAQFFGDLHDFCSKAADHDGKTVIVAGLDGDYLRRSFGSVLDIIPIADSVTKLSARCELCGKRALFTLRKTGETERELIAGADVYMPVCRKHYVSGQVVKEATRTVLETEHVQCVSL